MRRALEGLKIIEFAWSVAAPYSIKFLAAYGATVVKVESRASPDPIRSFYPFAGGVPGLERGGLYAIANTDKYHLSLSLKHPQGIEVAKRLSIL